MNTYSCFKGKFRLSVLNALGQPEREVEFANGTTLAGLADQAACYFGSGTQRTSWYLGLIDSVGFVSLSPSDVMSSHAGWAELTNYSQTTRPQWVVSTSGGVASNPVPAGFTASGNILVTGAFLVSDNTKNGTSGVLWATGLLATPQVVPLGQQCLLQYMNTGTGS